MTTKLKKNPKLEDNMDDCKSDPSSSQPKSGLTNQLFHRFEQLATLTQNNTYW